MEKEFVPYGLAVKLKALGFDEPCFAYQIKYQKPIIQIKVKNSKLEKQALIYRNTYKGVSPIKITLPTFSQAFRWFREKYNIYAVPMPFSGKNAFYIQVSGKGALKFDYDTYEEAELACLTKLIEIVEQK
jgi:hypothetical protein